MELGIGLASSDQLIEKNSRAANLCLWEEGPGFGSESVAWQEEIKCGCQGSYV